MTSMKIFNRYCLPLLLVISFCPWRLAAQAVSVIDASLQMETEKERIARCYEAMYRAMIAKDTATLGSLLDDSFVLVHMTGMRQLKAEYLRSIAQGTLNYYSCENTQLDITAKDNRALLIGRSRVNAAVFGGGHHTWRLQLDIDLEKKGGRWLMTEARASTY